MHFAQLDQSLVTYSTSIGLFIIERYCHNASCSSFKSPHSSVKTSVRYHCLLGNMVKPISTINNGSLSHFNVSTVRSQSDGAGQMTEAPVPADSSSSGQLINRWAEQTTAAESLKRDEVPHQICWIPTTAGVSLEISLRDWRLGGGVHVAMSEGQAVLDQSDGDFNLLREKREVYFQEEWMRICNLRSFIVLFQFKSLINMLSLCFCWPGSLYISVTVFFC